MSFPRCMLSAASARNSSIDLNLNAGVNNLQALAEKVDELDIGPSINAGVDIDPPADDDLIPVVDVSLATPSLKKLTWSNARSRFLSKALMLNSDGTKTIAAGLISITGEGSRILIDTEGGAAANSMDWYHRRGGWSDHSYAYRVQCS